MSLNTQDSIKNISSENELREEMRNVSELISCKFYLLKQRLTNVNVTLNVNFNKEFINNNFDNHELIEEQFDELFYEYNKVKEFLKKGREIRYYYELKEKELNEKKIISN